MKNNFTDYFNEGEKQGYLNPDILRQKRMSRVRTDLKPEEKE